MWIRTLFAAVSISGWSALVLAQRGGSGPRGPQGPGEDDGGYAALAARAYQENRLDQFAGLLKLNKQQKNEAKETFDTAQKEAAPVRDQIQKARAAIATAYLNKQSQPEIDQLIGAYANLQALMTGIEMKAFAKLCESLTAEQQKRAGSVFPLMSGIFSGRDWNRAGH